MAVTDILKIAANGLPTVRTCDLMQFIKDYCQKEDVERIVIGEPKTMRGEASESMRYISPFVARLKREMPEIPVEMYDERFTSAIAHREMIAGGMKRSKRSEKGMADEIAAVIILTDYLERCDATR